MIKEKVGAEERRKRSRRMSIKTALLQRTKERRADRFADQGRLKKRARRAARAVVRRHVAGLQGTKYNSLSTSQKMAIDRLVDQVPKSRMDNLAKNLVRAVTAAERERLRKRKQSKRKPAKTASAKVSKRKATKNLGEANIDHINRLHRRVRAQKSTHKRRAGTGHDQNRWRRNPEGVKRSQIRLGKKEIAALAGGHIPDSGEGSGYPAAAVRAMLVDRPDKLKNLRDRKKDRAKNRGPRSDLERLSTTSNVRDIDTIGGHGVLKNDYEIVVLDYFINEASNVDMERFYSLFIRGLVPQEKIQLYKRIFDDLNYSIRFQRYRKEIVDIVNSMIDLITDSTLYPRVRAILMKGKQKT